MSPFFRFTSSKPGTGLALATRRWNLRIIFVEQYSALKKNKNGRPAIGVKFAERSASGCGRKGLKSRPSPPQEAIVGHHLHLKDLEGLEKLPTRRLAYTPQYVSPTGTSGPTRRQEIPKHRPKAQGAKRSSKKKADYGSGGRHQPSLLRRSTRKAPRRSTTLAPAATRRWDVPPQLKQLA